MKIQLRAAIYARFSTDMQRDASIEDQVRSCRDYAVRHELKVVDVYSDRALSGASLMRPGIHKLLSDGRKGAFDVVLSEGLDRLSRNQADIAQIYQTLMFSDVAIETLTEGPVSEMHIGLKGTMNALFLKDLGVKTHRGLKGRALAGKSAGGLTYGYRVVTQFDAKGEPVRGDRTILSAEAEVVRRIFTDYAKGISPKKIAEALNLERILGPQGGQWGASTIHGNRERGTGILNNQLYIGRQIWNRLRYVKDPQTGKRVSRLNAEADWVMTDVPDTLWRWPNFSPAEIACRGTGQLKLHPAALDILQALRDRLGKPLIIRSAYRSPEHNRAVGGAKHSKHMDGTAFDIAMANHDPVVFEAAAREVGFLGFGFYPRSRFIHVDLGPERVWGESFAAQATAFAVEAPRAREVLAESRTMKGSGAAGVATVGAAGVEVAQDILAETQSAILPLAPYLDTLRWVFIAVALIGIAVAIHARIDDWKRGRR